MSQIAETVSECGTSRDLSHFISSSPWSSEEVMKLTRSQVIQYLGPGGAIIIDETGQQKYGTDSVGTSHQYLGNIGHTCNAQVGVFASYCVDNLSVLIDYRLFLSESWVRNDIKRIKTGVPFDRIEHKTKPELALEMLDSFISEGIPFTYVQADGLYGHDSKFISGLYNRGVRFICDIPSDTLVYITEPEPTVPERQGNKGRFPTKLRVLNTSPVPVRWLAEIQKYWESATIRLTDRGVKVVDCAELPVWRRRDGVPERIPIKLLMIRDPDEDMIRFAFTNMLDVDITDLAKCQANRYWIERNFEDAKGLCDLASFRGRSYNSWHHHIALSAIALLFLVILQIDFKNKSILLSLNQIVSIIRHKNPLRHLSSEELAKSINRINDLRIKMWVGKMKRFLKKRYESSVHWMTRLIGVRSNLEI